MTRVVLWWFEHSRLTFVIVVLITLVLGWELRGLRIDDSGEGLMLLNDPARDVYERAAQRFGTGDLTIVLIQADDVFTPAVLATVRRLSEGFERLAGVRRVESLTTVKALAVDGDTLHTEPLVGDVIPVDPAALARIRAHALGHRVVVGHLVAANGRATALVLHTAPSTGDAAFNARFSAAVNALIDRERRPGTTIVQVGTPLTRATYTRSLADDLKRLIPLSAAVAILTLFLMFRRWQGVVVPLVTAAVSIVWGLGMMAALGIPVNILTSMIPPILLAIGGTEDVHMLTAYLRLLAEGHDRPAAIRDMLEESGLPIVVTTATTVLGFASLVFTDITVLIQFGVAASLALTGNYVATVLILPLMLRLSPAPRSTRRSGHDLLAAAMERLAAGLLRWRVAVFVIWGTLAVASMFAWPAVRVDTDLITYFPRSSAIRAGVEELHTALAGGLTFHIVVDTGHQDGATDPVVLRFVARLQDFLAGTGRIDTSISVVDYLRTMHREMNGGGRAFEVVPDSRALIAQYLLVLDAKEMGSLIDFQASALNVLVRHNLSASADLSALLRRLDAWAPANLPAGVTMRATGEGILFNNASDVMAENEVTSFLWTLLAIGIVHALLFRSPWAGLLSLVPNVIPVLCLLGLMGALRIPLNTATALVATIAIGIAVDDTVHHMTTYHRRLATHGDRRRAMIETLRIEGRPIVYVSLALALGFLTLTASTFSSTSQFGLLSALVILVAMVAELTLTPLVMYSTRLASMRVGRRDHVRMGESAG